MLLFSQKELYSKLQQNHLKNPVFLGKLPTLIGELHGDSYDIICTKKRVAILLSRTINSFVSNKSA